MVRWGAEQPVTVHKKGLVLNCETISWKVMWDVSYCTGVKVTHSCNSPPAGITPGEGREGEHPKTSHKAARPDMATERSVGGKCLLSCQSTRPVEVNLPHWFPQWGASTRKCTFSNVSWQIWRSRSRTLSSLLLGKRLTQNDVLSSLITVLNIHVTMHQPNA